MDFKLIKHNILYTTWQDAEVTVLKNDQSLFLFLADGYVG
jgi:hypothetical protein